jgi:hypothetical protein
MDTNQTASTTTYVSTPPPPTPTPSKGIFGTNIPSTVAFAVAVLMFLLPLSEIRCSGQALMKKSGLGFALGQEWKFAGGAGKDMMNDMGTRTGGKKEGNAQIFVIAALALAVAGLGLSFSNSKTAARVGMVSGIVGAGVLVAFMFDLKKWFNDGIAKQAAEKATEGADSMGLGGIGDAKLTLAFTPWFYLAVIGLLAAAFFCYKRMTEVK